MQQFELVSDFVPTGDQPAAIDALCNGVHDGLRDQVLLGVTGSGKTFTIANLVARLQRPTLVLAHNKTLAAQLYQEFKRLFPKNLVEYFVSYYDYYQPEAYVAHSDTFIEKEATINEEIDRMRHAATRALFERRDVLIVASVSCIYGLGSPEAYHGMMLLLERGTTIDRDAALRKLVEIQYERSTTDLRRGAFRVRGDTVEIWPSYSEDALRVEFWGDEIESLSRLDPVRGVKIEALDRHPVYPNSHYVTPRDALLRAIEAIGEEVDQRVAELHRGGKLLEAQRLAQRTNYDIELLREVGYCHGIENYSRHLTGRAPGEPPPTLLDYFPDDTLMVIDESHAMLPQIRGMYFGDRSRKLALVEHGFRLPSALDNRPLTQEEFEERRGQTLYISATPAEEELERTGGVVVEQVVRPTGLLDPRVTVRPIQGQVDDLLGEIRTRAERDERTLVTTLTKRMAEDLSDYYREIGVRVEYLHSEVLTLDRVRILRDLRRGTFDVLVGVNLLREGLDLPEVSLVAILDADKEGYLRSERSLIQTIGRAARNVHGEAILYADRITGSMKRAMDETARRRKLQEAYNEAHGITPETIKRAIDELMGAELAADYSTVPLDPAKDEFLFEDPEALEGEVKRLEREMHQAAEQLEFEKAAEFRDRIRYLREQAVLPPVADSPGPLPPRVIVSGPAIAAVSLGLDLSGVTLRIAGLSESMDRRLRDEWPDFIVAPPTDPWLDIAVEFADRAYSEVVYRPKAMHSTLSAQAASFGMPEGEASVAAPGQARFSLVAGLGDLSYYTMLNLMRACLAWVLPTRESVLLHAAGLVVDGRAFLLVGAEGAGKSTWARLGEQAGGRVVSDDLVLVDGSGPRYELLGTPFRSTHVAQYGRGRWPLAAILFPRHGDAAEVNSVPSLLSQARVTANLPFIADGIEHDPRVSQVVRRLVYDVSCADLTFARDPDFVELLRSWNGE